MVLASLKSLLETGHALRSISDAPRGRRPMLEPEFVYVTYIETTPEKLWHALTEVILEALLVRHRGETPTGRSARRSRWS